MVSPEFDPDYQPPADRMEKVSRWLEAQPAGEWFSITEIGRGSGVGSAATRAVHLLWLAGYAKKYPSARAKFGLKAPFRGVDLVVRSPE